MFGIKKSKRKFSLYHLEENEQYIQDFSSVLTLLESSNSETM